MAEEKSDIVSTDSNSKEKISQSENAHDDEKFELKTVKPGDVSYQMQFHILVHSNRHSGIAHSH